MNNSRDNQQQDLDPQETREWLDALEYVLDNEGTERANFLLERLSARMTKTGARLPYTITTPYRNTPSKHTAKRRPAKSHPAPYPSVDSVSRPFGPSSTA